MIRENLRRTVAAATLSFIALLTGCSAPLPPDTVRGALIIVGSGTQQGAINTWRDFWTWDNNRVSVNFSPDGQEIGLQALFRGDTYVATSDQPLSDTKSVNPRCGSATAFTIPTSISPVGVYYNLGEIKELRLDDLVLASIFAGDIKQWDDKGIQDLNPTTELPSKPIIPVISKSHSALTSAGQEYLSPAGLMPTDKNDPFTWSTEVAGTRVNEDRDVPQEVDDNFGTIAFMSTTEVGSRFNAAFLRFGQDFSRPTAEKIETAIAASDFTVSEQGVTVDMAPNSGAGYQLAIVNYQAFCASYLNEPTAQLVKSWAEFVVSDSGQSRARVSAGIYSPSQATLAAAQKLASNISSFPKGQ